MVQKKTLIKVLIAIAILVVLFLIYFSSRTLLVDPGFPGLVVSKLESSITSDFGLLSFSPAVISLGDSLSAEFVANRSSLSADQLCFLVSDKMPKYEETFVVRSPGKLITYEGATQRVNLGFLCNEFNQLESDFLKYELNEKYNLELKVFLKKLEILKMIRIYF
ncbi:hypothetical protein IIC68_01420 [archaeon]|nr:hypothetical protein [archaeon]